MKGNLRRLLAIFLALMLLSADVCAIAEAVATLTLPSALKVIEEEAFYGDTSIERVVVPEGAAEIRSRAFADSSLKEINLPESIEFIADDAFDGCERINVIATEGSYAYDWSVDNEFITPVPDSNPASDFEYSISDGEVKIYGYVGTSADVIIPSVIENYPVTSIYASAFEDLTSLTSIIIPDSVTSIGCSAFEYCTSLTSIILPNNLTAICEHTFIGCKSLSSITIPSSVVSIGDYAFGFCTSLTSITIPDSVNSIGENTFSNCIGLTEIFVDERNTVYTSEDGVLFSKDKSTLVLYPAQKNMQTYLIPNSVTHIGEDAFENCEALESIEINGIDTYIGDYAFEGCSNLAKIRINGSIASIGKSAFRNCDALGSIEINGSIASIGESAFYDCDALMSIAINGSIASIGKSAFYDCDALMSIEIPGGVTSIGVSAFSSCSSLTSVEINGSGALIGDSAFSACTELINIELYGSFVSTGKSAFEACINLTSVELNGSIGSIGEKTFYDCNSLRRIILPAGVTSIGKNAFKNCYSLMRIVIPVSVTSIGSEAFWNCPNNYTIYGEVGSYTEAYAGRNFVEYKYFNPDGDFDYSINNDEATIIRYAGCENEVTIPDIIANCPVTSIYDNAFSFCDADSVTIPDGVTSIGADAFLWCTNLTNIKIPDSMVSIGNSAFENCSNLSNISIPGSVISIGDNAFSLCSSLSSITIPDRVRTIGKSAFASCDNLTSIIVDENNAAYSSEDGILFDKDKSELLCYPEGKNADGYIIPTGVVSIGDDAFSYHNELTSITIPDGVTHIGKNAFKYCNLLNIILPDSVWSIGEGAFSNCYDLTNIVIPDGVTTIGDYAFFDCSNLENVSIPESVTKIGDGAFHRCWSLQSIQIPNGVTSIGKMAFYYCTDLTSLQIPESVISIGASAFYECHCLISVMIPASVNSIGEYAFLNCSSDLIIYGAAGSYAETYAEENGIIFEVYDSIRDTGAADIQNLPRVLQVAIENTNIKVGETLNLSVTCNAQTEVGELYSWWADSDVEEEDYYVCRTYEEDSEGHRVFKFEIPYYSAGSYRLRACAFTDGTWSTFSELPVITVEAGAPELLDVSMDQSAIDLGTRVVFSARTLNAEQIKMVVDDTWEFTYPTTGLWTIFDHVFTSDGRRSICFSVCGADGEWTLPSDPMELDVLTGDGDLSSMLTTKIHEIALYNNENEMATVIQLDKAGTTEYDGYLLAGQIDNIYITHKPSVDKIDIYINGKVVEDTIMEKNCIYSENGKSAWFYPTEDMFAEPGEYTITAVPAGEGIEGLNGRTLTFTIVAGDHAHLWSEPSYSDNCWSQICLVDGCTETYILPDYQNDQTKCRHKWQFEFGSPGAGDSLETFDKCSICAMSSPSAFYGSILAEAMNTSNPMLDSNLRAYISWDLQKSGTSSERSWQIIDALERADRTYRDLFLNVYGEVMINFQYSGVTSNYEHDKKTLYISKKTRNVDFLPEFFHEFGHAIDFCSGNKGAMTCGDQKEIIFEDLQLDVFDFISQTASTMEGFDSLTYDDMRWIKAVVMFGSETALREGDGSEYEPPMLSKLTATQQNGYRTLIELLRENLEKESTVLLESYNGNYPENSTMIFDIIGGVTNNMLYIGAGHANKPHYWFKGWFGGYAPTYAQNREAFASFYSSKVLGYDFIVSKNQAYFSRGCSAFEKLAKTMLANVG